jgi:hypothetical protein
VTFGGAPACSLIKEEVPEGGGDMTLRLHPLLTMQYKRACITIVKPVLLSIHGCDRRPVSSLPRIARMLPTLESALCADD